MGLSEPYKIAMKAFEAWLATTPHPVTLFVIADLFESEEFGEWFNALLAKHGERLTVGCHGLTHRSWSAWPEDGEGFEASLKQATAVLKEKAGGHFRPWFRAPAGYIAPWMAKVLAGQRYSVDSSVNPSWLVRKKAGKGNSWADVNDAMAQNGVLERQWATRFSLPVNGPALTMFPLSVIAKGAWKKAPSILTSGELDAAVQDSTQPLVTLYWHVLDHARNKATWAPPL
jgi:peptidoglycan/xylan/chitin deacetylase (PgdA/CDA1 family)